MTAATGGPSSVPDKLYFKIGEVARLIGVEPHVLRYWEREVKAIRPEKTRSRQRRYRRKDVTLFFEVRRLLHEEKFTLAGVKKRIAITARSLEDDGAWPPGTSTIADSNVSPSLEPSAAAPAHQRDTPSPLSGMALARLRQGLEELIALSALNPE